MTEIKNFYSQLRKQQKEFRSEIRRLARVIAQYLPHRVALILAPRPTRRAVRNVTRFEIGGNITRSFILALPHVNVEGINIKAVFGGIVITIVVVSVVTSTTPTANRMALETFVRGDPYRLDAVITPFRVVNSVDSSCDKFAQDFNDRLAGAMRNNDPQSVSIWLPEQVAGVFVQANKDGMRIDQFAETRQIDVLFYGDIECDGQKAVVRPHVLAQALFYRGAPEMAAFYNFDDMTVPLLVTPGDNSSEQTARELAARIATLIDMGRGFRMLAANSANELRQASVLFQHLAESGAIADRHGLALLQYLTGKAQIAGAIDACNNIDQNMLQQAEDSLSKALLHEPEFALALAYLGTVSVYQASALPARNVAEVEAALNKALSRFQRAMDARVQPVDSLARVVATVGEAQAKIALHDANPASDSSQWMLADARESLNEAIRTFDTARAGQEIKATIAFAYALSGDLNRAGFNDEQALASYGKVASLTDDRRLQAAIAQSMAELYTVHGDACSAAQQYLTAAQTTCEADNRKYAAQAEQMQFYCKQTNDARAR